MSDETKKNTQNLNIPNDIAQLASSVFGDPVKVEQWLNAPIHALRGDTPIARLKTGDADEVRTILHKIKNGEFP
jgi:uncharacterized protein (DUF2384 family)